MTSSLTCPRCNGTGRITDPNPPLTARQLAVLNMITAYHEKHGVAPSHQEIADALGFRSLATVHEHLSNLARKEYIRIAYNTSRGITILRAPSSTA